jgi:uncharacterized protein involved in exopolysaccharide biosynthesis
MDNRGPNPGQEVATALRRFWWVALLVAVPIVLGGAWYARSLPDEYSAQAVVAFVPRERADTSADMVSLLLPKYAVYAKSDQTLRRVAGRQDEDPEEVKGALQAVVPPDTAQLELTLDLGDARRSAQVANAVADDVVRYTRSDPVLSGSVITDAVPPSSPTGPSRLALVAVAGVVALAAGVLAAVLAHRQRPVAVRRVRPAGPEDRARQEPMRPRIPETTAR